MRNNLPIRSFYSHVRTALITLIVLLSVFFFTIHSLGNNALWHDEAEVATVAKNVLSFGVPTVWDGYNFLPIAHDSSFHAPNPPYLFSLQTWLMFYVAAGGLLLFGPSVTAVRLPFVLIGLLALYVFYRLVRFLTEDVRVSLIATTLLGFSVQYDLLIRQARYYSLVFFFSLLSTYFFARCCFPVDRKKWSKKYLALYLLSLLSLFHSHYLSFFSILVGFVVYFIYQYGVRRITYRPMDFMMHPFIMVNIFLIVLIVPWMLFVRQGLDIPRPTFSMVLSIPYSFLELLKKINRSAPLLIFLVGAGAIIAERARFSRLQLQKYLFLLFLLFLALFIVAVTTSFQLPPSINPEFRYVLAVFPLFFLFIAYAVHFLYVRSKLVGVLLLLLLVASNIFSLPIEAVFREDYWPLPASRLSIRSYLWDYVRYELLEGYTGPVDAVVDYLRGHIRVGDKAFISSEGVSVAFSLPQLEVDNDYTFEREVGRNFTPEDLLSYRWIVFREVCPIECIFGDEWRTAESLLKQHYNSIRLPVFDYIVQNREEISYHTFRTLDYEPRVVLYEKNGG